MAKSQPKRDPEEYTVTLRNSSQRWTVQATDADDAIQQVRKRFKIQRDPRNMKATPTRLLPAAGSPSIQVPTNDDPAQAAASSPS